MNKQIKFLKKSSINIGYLTRQIKNESEYHININQKFIFTTEDKIRICLSKHLKQLERKRSWCAPLGILIAIVATLFTSTFKSAFGLSPDILFIIFIIAGVAACIWLIWSIKESLNSKKIEDIVGELKNVKLE